MALQYIDEMRLTQHFLNEFKLRMSDKSTDVLPPQGVPYDGAEPTRKSLIGCLGPAPSPDYYGPQSPNALGMVLLVTPDAAGLVRVQVSGQFDVAHRYIPDRDNMERDLLVDNYEGKKRPRRGQLISAAFQKYTIRFEKIELCFDKQRPNTWVSATESFGAILSAHGEFLKQDRRVMRRCQLNNNGGAKFNFNWHDDALDSQETLNATVYAQIFDRPDEILDYKVDLRGRLRPAPAAFGDFGEQTYLLELYLENQTTTEDAKPFGVEFPFLMDTRLEACLHCGIAHEVPHRLKPEDYRYKDDDGLPGYGISCSIERLDHNRFVTNTMPTTAQIKVDAPLPMEVGMHAAPHYLILSEDPLPVLQDFLGALTRYQAQWEARIAQLRQSGDPQELTVALREQEDFSQEIARINDGITLLKEHPRLLQAFRWMNEAMSRAIMLQRKKFLGWHLFQLGFILSQIRCIFERMAPNSAVKGSLEIAEVLWFSTGGGKTEAYLGIISMLMLYSRMNGREYGTSAWMRFPLRMLSVQQFQRLSYVVAQTNQIRQREGLGGWPFSIGYYTGSGTPNRITSSYGEDRSRGYLPALSEDMLKSYQFISDCPYCGQVNSIAVTRDYPRARIKHVCTNAECWTNAEAEVGARGEGIRGEIGIYVSDEECYRYLPTVLVGTVDKLAVIGHNKRFVNFMGGAKYFCPEHGFTQSSKCEHKRITVTRDTDEAKECGNNTRTSAIKVQLMLPMKDPGFQLLVQDELHLLSESLGNFSGHYESLLSALQISHGGRTPKRLAATATIKDYEQHLHHLYLKRAVRFPCPGVNQGESFYARKATNGEDSEQLIRRWFAGILPIGRGRVAMQAVAEVSHRFLDQIDEWRHKLRKGDPSFLLRIEISPAIANDALQYIEKNLNTNLIYANSKRNISEVQRYMEEIPNSGTERNFRQLDGNSNLDFILDTIHHVENKGPNDTCRTVIATSVVSHGVDISELNFMVMAGWPKSTAEYIQASARSGRVHPGIVVCVLSSKQLFETNVFLNFNDYHQFLDKLVDSVPINRFAPNVLDRTLPGIMAAVLLNWAPQQKWGEKLNNNVSPLVALLKSSHGGSAAKDIRAVVQSALQVPKSLEEVFDPRVVAEFQGSLEKRIKNALYELENWSGGKQDQTLSEALGDVFGTPPFRSFRDIENQIGIKPASAEAEAVIMALAR